MTEISQIELIYSQIENLNNQIEKFLDDDEYDIVLEKIKTKDALIKNLAIAIKTADISPEQEKIFNERNREISKKNFEFVDKLKKRQQEISEERMSTQRKIKLQNAYSVEIPKKNSIFCDTDE